MTLGLTLQTLILALALIPWIWVPSIMGEPRWAILSAFPKPMPVRHNARVFPQFFTTNAQLDLPYLPYDNVWAPLGEDRPLLEQGSLCFQLGQNDAGDCIVLAPRALGWFGKRGDVSIIQIERTDNSNITDVTWKWWQEVIWMNGTFLPYNTEENILPQQKKVAPHCTGAYEDQIPPWSECQSFLACWADKNKTFSFSPNMMAHPKEEFVMKKGLFLQDRRMNPFHKWLICGVNGSCSELNPFSFINGGSTGMSVVTGRTRYTEIGAPGESKEYFNSTEEVVGWNKILVNQTDYSPSPVCVYPPFLFILSNQSFNNCSSDSCWMSQCWNATRVTRALVARVPRLIPVPVETPSTLSLFRQKRDFGITAAIVTAIAVSAAAATAAGVAMATTVQTGTTLNQLSATVVEAINLYTSASAQLKGGLMIVNQRLDLVEERLDILFQMAQLGCERKLGALCITSVQYENFTRAANLSRRLSLYLSGNWSEGFEETLEALRAAVVAINATRVDLSLTEGLSSWISSAFSFFKEWVGVAMFGIALCCGLVFMLWLVCKLKAQQKRDKVAITQALIALEQGASPAIWLSMLRK